MKKKLHISYNAPVVLTFILICLVVLVIGILTGGASTRLLFMTYHSSLLNPLTYLRFFTHVFGHADWTYLRFFTHVFGHADWAHFIGNASYILLLGPMLEEKYGSKMLIEIILVAAVVTGIVNYLFFWNVGLCGASGVVFAFIVIASFTNFREGEIPLTFILVACIFIGQQVYEGIVVSDNISNTAHIIGGLVGSVAGYFLNRKAAW